MPAKHQAMKITTFKFQFFAGVTIFSLFSGISVYAQSPNEMDSLQTEEISQDNRIKITATSVQVFSEEKKKYVITTERVP